jgi:DNA-binding CsgD family transcriptional regulator
VWQDSRAVGGRMWFKRREVQVLAGITKSLGNHAIANEWGIRPNTLKTYVRQAYKKMGVTSRSQPWDGAFGMASIHREARTSSRREWQRRQNHARTSLLNWLRAHLDLRCPVVNVRGPIRQRGTRLDCPHAHTRASASSADWSSDSPGCPACRRASVSSRFEACEEIQQADDSSQKRDGSEDAGNQVPHVHPRTHPGPFQQVLSEHGLGLAHGRVCRASTVSPVRFA